MEFTTISTNSETYKLKHSLLIVKTSLRIQITSSLTIEVAMNENGFIYLLCRCFPDEPVKLPR
jgi:hypothetical protein